MTELLDLFARPDTWISFFSLFVMLMILDIDNVIFISVLTTKMTPAMQPRARLYGLYIGMGLRLALLLGVDLLIANEHPLFTLLNTEISIKDLILVGGGLFLLTKSTLEIHNKLEGPEEGGAKAVANEMGKILIQLAILNLVFSMDSVITAVGMVKHKAIMVAAILSSMLLMFLFAKKVGEFVHRHPTIKMLALSFLLLIGALLIVEGIHVEVPKGYIYFAMCFSLFVEVLNMQVRKKYPVKPVELREPTIKE